MKCRPHCGACCIAPSITRPYYGMPNGKAAGEMCVHMDRVTMQCHIWQTEHYPAACRGFQAEAWVCGNTREEALIILTDLEIRTK